MGKLIAFIRQPQQEQQSAKRLVAISQEIDAILIKHLQAGHVEPEDLVGVLSHRLGSLMKTLEYKTKIWGFCEKVLKKQAQID